MVKLNKIIFSVDDKNFKYHANSPGYLTDQESILTYNGQFWEYLVNKISRI